MKLPEIGKGRTPSAARAARSGRGRVCLGALHALHRTQTAQICMHRTAHLLHAHHTRTARARAAIKLGCREGRPTAVLCNLAAGCTCTEPGWPSVRRLSRGRRRARLDYVAPWFWPTLNTASVTPQVSIENDIWCPWICPGRVDFALHDGVDVELCELIEPSMVLCGPRGIQEIVLGDLDGLL